MSTYDQHAPTRLDSSRRRDTNQGRPATLTGAAIAAMGAAVLNVVSAAGILISGMDAVKSQIAANQNSGDEPVTPDMIDPLSERAQSLYAIYSGLAYSTIFWSLVLALLAGLALRGGRVTRFFATVILAISLLLKVADLFIAMPTLSLIFDGPVAILALTAIVLFFLPASNGYRHTR
ncbi:hypothetical protein SAMN05444920_11380 [Nonomuraea solani]|uniref:Uncharacterized protein n=1 Tax=Nonomuraea solani TaxID=1144553 RepID=A0A1H6ES06_9ACTN|nr:hypothetical protein [Nonomuraea solani]SEG99484.1 hypothetical protein SAMN05444920_11380 [Nonomuraea solani]